MAISKADQKKLDAFIKEIGEMKTRMEAAHSFFSDLYDEEYSKFDDKSEKWKDSEKGQEVHELNNQLEAISDSAESLVDSLDLMLDDMNEFNQNC